MEGTGRGLHLFLCHFLEELRKPITLSKYSRSLDWYLNTGPSDYVAEVLTTRPWYLLHSTQCRVYTYFWNRLQWASSYKDFSVECLGPSINSFDPNAILFASPWQVLLNSYLTASVKFRLNAVRCMCHKRSRKYSGGYGVLGWMPFWNSFRTLRCGFVILLSGPELLFSFFYILYG